MKNPPPLPDPALTESLQPPPLPKKQDFPQPEPEPEPGTLRQSVSNPERQLEKEPVASGVGAPGPRLAQGHQPPVGGGKRRSLAFRIIRIVLLTISGWSVLFVVGMFAYFHLPDSVELGQKPEALASAASVVAQAANANRIAFVIGNNNYNDRGRFGDLTNPVADVALIAKALRDNGFEVEELYDASLRQMQEGLRRFGDHIVAGGDAVFTMPATVSSQKETYMMGTNTLFEDRLELISEGLQVDTVLATLTSRKPSSAIVILDCCRVHPDHTWLTSGTRGGPAGTGLSEIDAPIDAMIAFSAAPGQAALDSAGPGQKNSPYAVALAQGIGSGLEIEAMFKQVRRQVDKLTQGQQRPWENGSFLHDFYFSRGAGASTPAVPENLAATRSPVGPKVLSVPSEFGTIRQAVTAARPGDRIQIASGRYEESVFVDKSDIKFAGAGRDQTVLTYPGRKDSALWISGARNVTVTGMGFEHTGEAESGKETRYSVITVHKSASGVKITDCAVKHAVGNGITVLDRSEAEIARCEIAGCGWNAISAVGEGTIVKIEETHCAGNLMGIGFYQGATGRAERNHCESNRESGFLITGAGSNPVIEMNRSTKNEKYGVWAENGSGAVIRSNECTGNYGGIGVKGADTQPLIVGNTCSNNTVGIAVEKQAYPAEFDNNRTFGNKQYQTSRSAMFR
ncbi:MAG: caspase family protein [Verrucomicrobiales bacterium]